MTYAAGRQVDPVECELCMAWLLPRICGKLFSLMDV